jgi:hypothetical protein
VHNLALRAQVLQGYEEFKVRIILPSFAFRYAHQRGDL